MHKCFWQNPPWLTAQQMRNHLVWKEPPAPGSLCVCVCLNGFKSGFFNVVSAAAKTKITYTQPPTPTTHYTLFSLSLNTENDSKLQRWPFGFEMNSNESYRHSENASFKIQKSKIFCLANPQKITVAQTWLCRVRPFLVTPANTSA